MGKPSKLADLKLVNKYYPSNSNGITNYSYRSPKLDTTFQFELQVGRSSVGSDASVPSMEDDQESIVFIDGDDKSFYHASGAELWDKFWEDPFWEANAEEAKREADSTTQKHKHRHESYPALIPSPDESHPKDQYFLGGREAEAGVAYQQSQQQQQQQQQQPMPVSVFELDSDSDEEEASFARRIARSFTSQKRTRSASAAPRSRKGHEVAKQQLKCAAQAETSFSSSSSSADDVEASCGGIRGADGQGSSEPRLRLRKQKSEVFGKVFWNRR
ncbi:hypothetical protein N0V82_006846 [Gnomoniopsis sp. IMI 355080]|nr:hypothetical protein N0V82_006846 [Gnomoniopsis sp. IMI 355080]